MLLAAVIFCAGCASSDQEEAVAVNMTENATVNVSESVEASSQDGGSSLGIILGGDVRDKDPDELREYLDMFCNEGEGPGWVFVEAEEAEEMDNIKMRVDVAHEKGFRVLLVPTTDWENFDEKSFVNFANGLSQECPSEAYLVGYNANVYFRPCDFVSVVSDCSEKIRTNDPDALIIVGGLSCGVRAEQSPERYVQDLYQCGLGDFDAISVNPDTYPELPSDADQNNWDSLGAVQRVMADNGDGSKEIWGTGFDVPTRGTGLEREVDARFISRDKDFMSEKAQAEIWKDAIDQWKKTKSHGVFFFPCSGSDCSFGMLRPDGSGKPSYQIVMGAGGDRQDACSVC